ncbi:MAG: tyrosine-type recombinase/integrase [Spirochaetaceae bacterium]|nr:tyrosine-type recombinase/integrase [Spirochaetaceae bacterium]
MKQQLIKQIEQKMVRMLNNAQIEKLHEVLEHELYAVEIIPKQTETNLTPSKKNFELLNDFLAAKQIEGCSARSISYYKSTLENAIKILEKPLNQIETEDLRVYLSEYQKKNNAGKQTIDNIRRILSSFFTWLEDENYILKSPVRRIHKIKTAKLVKETYTDENLVVLRDNCTNIRDLSIIDMLMSTGMRVGELVKLNIVDVDFVNRECVVFGKGSKERQVYFDARTKIHLQNYLNSRTDNNPALFVSLLEPHKRLEISGVEITLRKLGRKLGINKVHPHKFRRTLATRAIDKGMPIEQVQKLLGHQKIDTTMEYAMVDQENVKNSHKKYIS